jgi:uncharacterized phage protein gp47/JayE
MAEIPPPLLDLRNEDEIAAQAIARVSSSLTVALLDKYIGMLQALIPLVESGEYDEPLSQELTNANHSSPHTELLEAITWVAAQLAYRINQLPDRDKIAFANLFLNGLREATAATTTLRFSVTPPNGADVTIPEGTQVSTSDGNVIFETTATLLIPFGTATGNVGARRTKTGATLLAPNTLTSMVDPIGYVDAVTNLAGIDSGSNGETVNEALDRARSYQRRAERLVSGRDVEEAIFHEVLGRNGIVKAFPFIQSGNFEGGNKPGYTTLVVMTLTGLPVSDELQSAIRLLLEEQAVGNQFIDLVGPIYVDFNVEVAIQTTGLISQSTVRASVERNLRTFYAPRLGNFGRKILRAEIIAVIEGTDGVERIIPASEIGPILVSPVADIAVVPYKLPRLLTVTITAS